MVKNKGVLDKINHTEIYSTKYGLIRIEYPKIALSNGEPVLLCKNEWDELLKACFYFEIENPKKVLFSVQKERKTKMRIYY